jgi:hypothetical protein
MKYINNSINKKFSQGFNNILSPSLINLFIALSLLIIIALIYLKYNKIELYENPTTTQQQQPSVTLSSDGINELNFKNNTGYMSTIINNYLNSIQLKNDFQKTLDNREKIILDMADQINNIIS